MIGPILLIGGLLTLTILAAHSLWEAVCDFYDSLARD